MRFFTGISRLRIHTPRHRTWPSVELVEVASRNGHFPQVETMGPAGVVPELDGVAVLHGSWLEWYLDCLRIFLDSDYLSIRSYIYPT